MLSELTSENCLGIMVVSRKGQRCRSQFPNQWQREATFKNTSISS